MKKVNAAKVAKENPFISNEESEIPASAPKFPVLKDFELPEQDLKKK